MTVLGVAASGLVAWRWWLTERAAERRERVVVDQAKLDALPTRLSALEQQVRDLEWKKR